MNVDTALIIDGAVFQVWRGRTIEQALGEGAQDGQDLREFPTGSVNCGQVWNGEALSDPVVSLADRKDAMLTKLSDTRWRRTLTFDYDGETHVPADPALSVITALAVADQLAPSGEALRTFKLKSPGVFRQWTIAQIVAYGMAIGVHVQACFDREAALAAAIEAAPDHDALAALDLTSGWPV